MKYQPVKFRAVKVVRKPTKVKFYTKDGNPVYFKAVVGIEKPIKVD